MRERERERERKREREREIDREREREGGEREMHGISNRRILTTRNRHNMFFFYK